MVEPICNLRGGVCLPALVVGCLPSPTFAKMPLVLVAPSLLLANCLLALVVGSLPSLHLLKCLLALVPPLHLLKCLPEATADAQVHAYLWYNRMSAHILYYVYCILGTYPFRRISNTVEAVLVWVLVTEVVIMEVGSKPGTLCVRTRQTKFCISVAACVAKHAVCVFAYPQFFFPMRTGAEKMVASGTHAHVKEDKFSFQRSPPCPNWRSQTMTA